MNNNKLIAEFMGLPTEVFKSGKVNYYFREFNSGTWYEEHELSYNVSWDWLMPVLDKIKEIRCLPDEHDESFSWVCKSSDIEAEYNAVVEFIKEYNDGQG